MNAWHHIRSLPRFSGLLGEKDRYPESEAGPALRMKESRNKLCRMWKKGSVCKVLLNGWTLWFPAVVIVVLLFTFLFRTIGVEGTSMSPTLSNGDRLIVTHLFYQPAPGDIVVIVQPESDTPAIIKRIIAVEGQTVDINFSFVSSQWMDRCWKSLISMNRPI